MTGQAATDELFVGADGTKMRRTSSRAVSELLRKGLTSLVGDKTEVTREFEEAEPVVPTSPERVVEQARQSDEEDELDEIRSDIDQTALEEDDEPERPGKKKLRECVSLEEVALLLWKDIYDESKRIAIERLRPDVLRGLRGWAGPLGYLEKGMNSKLFFQDFGGGTYKFTVEAPDRQGRVDLNGTTLWVARHSFVQKFAGDPRKRPEFLPPTPQAFQESPMQSVPNFQAENTAVASLGRQNEMLLGATLDQRRGGSGDVDLARAALDSQQRASEQLIAGLRAELSEAREAARAALAEAREEREEFQRKMESLQANAPQTQMLTELIRSRGNTDGVDEIRRTYEERIERLISMHREDLANKERLYEKQLEMQVREAAQREETLRRDFDRDRKNDRDMFDRQIDYERKEAARQLDAAKADARRDLDMVRADKEREVAFLKAQAENSVQGISQMAQLRGENVKTEIERLRLAHDKLEKENEILKRQVFVSPKEKLEEAKVYADLLGMVPRSELEAAKAEAASAGAADAGPGGMQDILKGAIGQAAPTILTMLAQSGMNIFGGAKAAQQAAPPNGVAQMAANGAPAAPQLQQARPNRPPTAEEATRAFKRRPPPDGAVPLPSARQAPQQPVQQAQPQQNVIITPPPAAPPAPPPSAPQQVPQGGQNIVTHGQAPFDEATIQAFLSQMANAREQGATGAQFGQAVRERLGDAVAKAIPAWIDAENAALLAHRLTPEAGWDMAGPSEWVAEAWAVMAA